MAKKKKVNSSSQSSNQTLPDLKAKNSDDNLNLTNEPESETPSSHIKIKKRSLVSLPGEESEEEDEFLFIRLKKHIKNHWDKLMEHYPNGNIFFKSPQIQTDQIIARNISTSTNSSASTKSAAIHYQPSLLSSAIKSTLLLPGFSCKRDDEGHRTVPFISSLLEVNENTKKIRILTFCFRYQFNRN